MFTLAALVAFIVQFVKRQLERQGRSLSWYVTLLVALVVSEGLSALLFYSEYGARFGGAPPPWTWIIFGLVAAMAGAGGRDLLMGFAERGKPVVVTSGSVVAAPDPPGVPAPPINPRATIIIERDDPPELDTGPSRLRP